MSRQRRNTLAVLAILLAALGIGYLVQSHLIHSAATVAGGASNASGSSSAFVPGLYARIEVNGDVYATLPLAEDTELTVSSGSDGYNLVEIESGAVFVEDANCGDQTCVHMGKMQNEGDLIACLPHGMIIYVVNLTEPPEEDTGS